MAIKVTCSLAPHCYSEMTNLLHFHLPEHTLHQCRGYYFIHHWANTMHWPIKSDSQIRIFYPASGHTHHVHNFYACHQFRERNWDRKESELINSFLISDKDRTIRVFHLYSESQHPSECSIYQFTAWKQSNYSLWRKGKSSQQIDVF